MGGKVSIKQLCTVLSPLIRVCTKFEQIF